MKKSDKQRPQASGGAKETEINKNQRAPLPGSEKEAAGKDNSNKQKKTGQIGSEPVGDDEINRGE